eukprot:SAG31_NODE_4058_length_3630_cov_2.188332_3_plen_141_part_00
MFAFALLVHVAVFLFCFFSFCPFSLLDRRVRQGKAAATFGNCGTEDEVQVEEAAPASQFKIFSDAEGITVRITPDRSLADWFVNGGQVAATSSWLSKVPRAAADSAVSVSSSGSGVTADIEVWGMGCGWLTPSYTDNPSI